MDAVASTGRPPFPMLTFVLLPNVVLAGVMALRPPPGIRFVASLALICTIVHASMTYTLAGAPPVANYSLGSFLGSMLLNTTLFAWPLEAAKSIHYLRYPGPLAEKPFWIRFWHSLCVIFNPRLIGTNAQVPNVPAPIKGTRTRHILQCLRQFLVALVVIDVFETFMFTHEHLYDPTRSDAYFPFGLAGYLARPACMALWLVWSYETIKVSYALLSAVAVGSHLWGPESWPDLFGTWSEAYTVRRFWGRAWHQMFRRVRTWWGNFIVDTLRIPRGTFLSSQAQVHVAFALSALMHCIGDLVLGKEHFGKSWMFFAVNGLAITFEDLVIALARCVGISRTTRLTRVVGYVWVCLWFTHAGRLHQEWTYRAGCFDPVLGYSPTKEILVPFM
ncbi:membrane bound O-acyl transferase family-domain-containing protein [Lenzites betulinus]|nr:membrane bound O-acyl transferase family-domain-containing protein [Lenzites betulinus]